MMDSHSKTLLTQAVRALEAGHAAHQSILQAAKNPSMTRESLRSDIATDCESDDGIPLWKNYAVEIPSVLEKISSIETVISEVKLAKVPDNKVEEISGAEATPEACSETSEVFTSSKEAMSTPIEIEVSQTVGRYVPPDLAAKLKSFRVALEAKCAENGLSVPLIQVLHELEKRLGVQRDVTTSSLWNMDHQEQRKLVFDKTTEKVVYRQKCQCKDEDGKPIKEADSDGHEKDVHCPRNIDLHEDEERKRRKDPTTKATSESIIAITMDHVGRQNIKDHFSMIRNLISSRFRRPKPWEGLHLGIVLTGPGNTGKAIYARNYAKYLIACGVSNDDFCEIDATNMLHKTEPWNTMMQLSNNGGVLFINNAHRLASFKMKERSVLEYIFKKIAKNKGKIVLIISGHEQEVNALLAVSAYKHLAPYVLHCPAFKEEEVMNLISKEMLNWFGLEVKVEDGWEGLYMRIAAKRVVAKERIQNEEYPSYDKAVENLIKDTWTRHYQRLVEERKSADNFDRQSNGRDGNNPENKGQSTESSPGELETAEPKSGPVPPENKRETSDPLATSSLNSKEPESIPSTTKQDQPSEPPATEEPIDNDFMPPERDEKPSITHDESPDPPIDDGPVVLMNKKTSEPGTPDPKADASNKNDVPVNEKNAETTLESLPTMLDEPNIKFTGPHLFTKSDILGECPGLKMQDSKHWKKLQMLTGLEEVKKSLLYLSELAKTNYERELLELPPIDFTFNRLFLGPPGTGKSVVAKLYGQILAEMGVLSKGHVVVKNATALIGKYIGWSEANTTAALEEAKGGVLVIDEAYTLASDDIYRKAIVTTLVGGIQNVPGEDRCVILIGYEDKMRKLLEDANPGLARRFPMEDAFLFKGYSIPQLKSILQAKLDEYKISANDKAMKAALDVLEKARSKLNFGNGGEVENLITRAKSNCLARLMEIPLESRPKVWSLEPQDFDPEYNRVDSATTKLKALFADVVDCEPIIAKFEQYQIVSKAMKSRDLDPHLLVPTTFVFKGPPGTGKTTTARKIAQVYYDMGFLSAPEVVECSVTDLIGSYVGQTGPKTIKALERGLGKVLFIDEAYRFAQHDGSSDSFASDAISELVDSLTKPKFMGKIIVILAGYEDEMNSLLQMNPGLASRFSEEVIFKLISPAGCITVLQKKLRDQGIEFPIADTKNGHEFGKLENIMHTLSNTKGWGNARDVETLGKMISRKIFAKMTDGNNSMVCDAALALETTEDFSKERQARTDVGASLSHYI